MSTEIGMLLAQAASAPSRPLDVGSIMRRGDRIRVHRMLATIAAVPLVVGGLWMGARAGLSSPVVNAPAANPGCDWSSDELQVFLISDASRAETVALAREVRKMDHVESVKWNDLFEKSTTIKGPNIEMFWARMSRLSFPPWMDVSIDDSAHSEEVVDTLWESALVDHISGGRLRPPRCRVGTLESQKNRLENQLQRLREKLERKQSRLQRELEESARR